MKSKIIAAVVSLSLLGASAQAQPRPPETTAPAPGVEPGEVERSRRLLLAPGELRPSAAVESSTGWKIAFWITAAATVGLATGTVLAGASMESLEDEKLDLVTAYRQRTMDHYAFVGEDICIEAELRGDASEITSWCEDGEDRFVRTYVVLGLTIAGAIASSALLYRAYFHSPSIGGDPPEPERSPDSAPIRWMITPGVSARGGGLGFVLRF